MGQIVAVVSGKGGTGKTSLTAAIASCLAARDHRVLCIDLDVGLRNLDLSLGLSHEATITFQDIINGCYTPQKIPVHPKQPNLYLLTAPVAMRQEDIAPDAFGTMLRSCAACFDWILLDAPAGIGAGFRMAVSRADRAIVVSGADPGSLRDAGCTANLARHFGPSEPRLVVNRLSPRLLDRMRTNVDDMMDATGLPLLGIVPEDYRVVLAANRGELLLHTARRGAIAACKQIARRLDGDSAPLLNIR